MHFKVCSTSLEWVSELTADESETDVQTLSGLYIDSGVGEREGCAVYLSVKHGGVADGGLVECSFGRCVVS